MAGRAALGVDTEEAYEALRQPEGLAGWWAASAVRSPTAGGELTIGLPGYPDHVWAIDGPEPSACVVFRLRSTPEPRGDSVL